MTSLGVAIEVIGVAQVDETNNEGKWGRLARIKSLFIYIFLARAVGVAVGLRSFGWPSSKRQITKVSEVDWLELKICSSTLFFGTSGRRCSRSEVIGRHNACACVQKGQDF